MKKARGDKDFGLPTLLYTDNSYCPTIILLWDFLNMKYKFFFLYCLFGSVAIANNITYSIAQLEQDQGLTEKLLSDMLSIDRIDLVDRLLPIYQSFPEKNLRLVNYAKIRQARSLFLDYQNNKAKKAFQALQTEANVNDEERSIIQNYLQAIENRERWQFSLGGNYLQTKNVNNTSNERHIENTDFVKNDDMLPQSAHGLLIILMLRKIGT